MRTGRRRRPSVCCRPVRRGQHCYRHRLAFFAFLTGSIEIAEQVREGAAARLELLGAECRLPSDEEAVTGRGQRAWWEVPAGRLAQTLTSDLAHRRDSLGPRSALAGRRGWGRDPRILHVLRGSLLAARAV